MPNDPFACPACSGELELVDNNYKCQSCKNSYLIRKGIVDFRCRTRDYYFNPVEDKDMERLLASMTEANWQKTIQTFINLVGAKSPDSWLDNLITDGRYAWKIFLDLDDDKSLLDIGCGLGNLVKNLAPQVSKTYGMDLTYKRLEFTKNRITYFNAKDDIGLLAGGDGNYLPFFDSSIDCVVLSGVLEWIGEGDTSRFDSGDRISRLWYMITSFFGGTNPRRMQIAFLKEIRRVLKENGELFIGIENRLNYEYFLGRVDHHSGLLFGSLLPRFVANLYSIAKVRRPYRTYTYSIPGYKKLLKAAGFSKSKYLGLERGYSFLNSITPCEGDFFGWKKGEIQGLKEKTKKNRYFFPAYGIIASSCGSKKNSLHDRLLTAVSSELETIFGEEEVRTTHYEVTGKDKLVIKGSFGEYPIILKIPLNDSSHAAENTNMEILNGFDRSKVVPRFLAKVDLVKLHCYVEERILGNSFLDNMVQWGREELVQRLNVVIDEFGSVFEKETNLCFEGECYERLVSRPLRILDNITNSHYGCDLLAEYFFQHLRGRAVRTGISHGDLSVSNVIFRNNGETAFSVIDWEAGAVNGLPILDVINMIGSVHRALNVGVGLNETIVVLNDSFRKGNEWWDLMDKSYQKYQIDNGLHIPFVYLNWLQNINILSKYSLPYDTSAIKRNVIDVLEVFQKSQ